MPETFLVAQAFLLFEETEETVQPPLLLVRQVPHGETLVFGTDVVELRRSPHPLHVTVRHGIAQIQPLGKDAQHVRLLVQLRLTAAGTGEIECPKFRICLVDAAHAVAPQPDELPAVISEGRAGRRAVAGGVERLHFGQRNAVDSGGAVGDELVKCAPLFPDFIEKPVERRAAQAVGIAHQERIVRLHPPAHPAEDVGSAMLRTIPSADAVYKEV